MKKERDKRRIALIGTYPPPYGGISIHIQRFKEQLEQEGYECVVYESKRWKFKFPFSMRGDIIHCHSSDWRIYAIMGLARLLGKKTVTSIHGASLEDLLLKSNWLKKLIVRFTMRRTSFIIAVNSQIRKQVLSLGVEPRRVKVIPAFIPPGVREQDVAEIPRGVWDFIGSHTPVIAANAFRVVHCDNEDLYGIDMCIDLCVNLKQSYPSIGFVFCLPQIGDYEYFGKMKQRIIRKDIVGNFLFQTEPCQLYPIIMRSDVFVRPTNADGYAVSVAEAIYFKVPTVASDICQRPEGTVLFKNRDIGDFTLKVAAVLGNYKQEVAKLEKVEPPDYAGEIMEVYRTIEEVK